MPLPWFRRRPKPTPAPPHILHAMDSVRYPLAPRGSGADTTAWARERPPTPNETATTEEFDRKDTMSTDDETPTLSRLDLDKVRARFRETDTTVSGHDKAADPSPVYASTTPADPAEERFDIREREPVVDEGFVKILAEMPTADEKCEHCRGTGKRMTTNDLLRESIGLIQGSEDDVIATFYESLLLRAPHLAPLFPPSLFDPLSRAIEGERTGRGQRDKLVAALAALATSYDRGNPEGMAVLDTHLAAFGRAHAAFRRPDGTVRGATVTEYHLVKVTLFDTLHEAAGDAWRPEYDDAWDEAYEYAARHMLAAQDTVDRPFGRYPRS